MLYSLIFRIIRYKSRVGLYRRERERGAETCIFVEQRRKGNSGMGCWGGGGGSRKVMG